MDTKFNKFKHAFLEIICIIFGHKWYTSFESIANGTKIERKIYCKRCGRIFKSHSYKINNKTYNSNKIEI